MKKALVAITSILLLALAPILYPTKYLHDTGRTSLEVNDQYPGGFVNHNLNDAPSDNLLRAFFALYFTETDPCVITGRVHDLPPMDSSEFVAETPLSIDSSESNYITSIHSFRPNNSFEEYELRNFIFQQKITSCNDSSSNIDACYTLINNSAKPLTNGKLLFFYEGDLPQDQYDYTDNAAIDTQHNCVYQFDIRYGIYSGFCIPDSSISPQFGNLKGLYDIGSSWNTREEGDAFIVDLIQNPQWDSLEDVDCGVYTIITLPSNMQIGDTFSFPLSFVAATNSTDFDNTLKKLFGEPNYITDKKESARTNKAFKVYPNPCENQLTIQLEGFDSPEIIITNLRGELIRELPVNNTTLAWDGKNSTGEKMPPGIYFIQDAYHQVATKVILLR